MNNKQQNSSKQITTGKYQTIVIYNNGDKYVGNRKNGKRNGSGIMYYNNGEIYEGDWKDDKRDGIGIEIVSNGERYAGNWKNGKRNGRGIQQNTAHKTISCQFSDDCANGTGEIYYDDGDKFQGEIEMNQPNCGTMYYKNGDKYVGNFDGKRYHGSGTYYFKNGDIVDVMYNYGDLVKDRIIRKVHNNKNKNAIYMQYISKHNYEDRKYFKTKYDNINVSNNYIEIQEDDKIKNREDINDKNVAHLKIFYSDRGCSSGRLEHIIQQISLIHKDVKIKSIYLSACSSNRSYYDVSGKNLFDDITKQIMGNNENCIGFVSLVKPSYTTSMKQTRKDYNNDGNIQYGIKRNASNESSITEDNEKPRKYYKDEDFEYYCILNENGKKNIYKIPADLCYWREDLIDKGIFQEAFEALKNGKDYSFTTDVRENGKLIKNKKITISLNKNIERIKPVEIRQIKPESYNDFPQYEIREVINDEAKNIKQNNNIGIK